VNAIDLRSDTVTRPTPAMRAAMAAAEVGDDVFGDDPSVNALQARMAALTGHEDALLMSSGTQSNLCALLAHCGRGDEYLVGQYAHCYRYEGGGGAVLGGIQPQPLAQDAAGLMALADIEAAIKPDDEHFARTRLLCLENTWNGQAMPAAYLEAATALARRRGLASHMDGARVFNAAAHDAGRGGDIGAALRAITERFDSVSVCCSKGLGAPVGSLLCGSRAFIARARRWRKAVGGGMRQAGLLAAAIDHALDHHVQRLHDDHERAARLAAGLASVPGLRVRSAATNIVFADVDGGRSAELLAFLAERGILATGLIGLRFVTHLGIDDDAIEATVLAVRDSLTRPPPANAGATPARNPY
jgi:threonine aldolase